MVLPGKRSTFITRANYLIVDRVILHLAVCGLRHQEVVVVVI